MSVITISRQFGAGGKTLGEMIAKELGYSFVYDEIIQRVARKANVSTHGVKFVENEAGGRLLKFMSGLVSKNYIERILNDKSGYIDEEVYVDLLNQIISQIAKEGNAVILGRGGQYILRDFEKALHVLLIAHKTDRIAFMEKTYNLSKSQALQSVNREDKRRANLFRKFGKEDYDHPDLYHLVLNMSRIDLQKAMRLILALVR